MRDGEGTMKWVNRDFYEGNWKEDRLHGKGKLVNFEGSYEGSFICDKREGEGTMAYLDGRKYLGNWLQDMHCGKGIMITPDGTKYDGEWKKPYEEWERYIHR